MCQSVWTEPSRNKFGSVSASWGLLIWHELRTYMSTDLIRTQFKYVSVLVSARFKGKENSENEKSA